MPRILRSRLVNPDVAGCWHVTSRCAREIRLLDGPDDDAAAARGVGGPPEEPVGLRKELMLRRIGLLTRVFCIEVLSFSMMGNHLHAAIRSHPEDGRGWSDAEVVRRWLLLHPLRDRRGVYEPREGEVEALVADTGFVERTRRKLMDLSQFMKEWKQHIAVEVNRLEGRGGPVWAGRFKSKPIVDHERGQLVRTMIYIDLNPLAAGLCDLPEDGLHTSLSARLGREAVPTDADGRPTRATSSDWLTPFDGDEVKDQSLGSAFGPSPARPTARVVLAGLTLPRYLRILDRLSRLIREGKASLDAFAADIFERLDLQPPPGPRVPFAARGAPAG